MPYRYYFDEEHIREWLSRSRTPEGVGEYLQKYVFETADFNEYLERIGGRARMEELRRIEHLQSQEGKP